MAHGWSRAGAPRFKDARKITGKDSAAMPPGPRAARPAFDATGNDVLDSAPHRVADAGGEGIGQVPAEQLLDEIE